MKQQQQTRDPQPELPDSDVIELATLIMHLTPHTRLAVYWLILAIAESEALAQLLPQGIEGN